MAMKLPNHSYKVILKEWFLRDLLTPYRRLTIIIFQLFIVVLAFAASFFVRFEFSIPPNQLEVFWKALPYLLIARMGAYYYYKLYSGWWRFVSIQDLMNILKAILLGSTLFVVAMVFALSGCAMIIGTATGALTGAVDAPAETYRHNREAFAEYPILFTPDVLVMGPLGIATGPLFGFAKGLALDVQWTIGDVRYGEVFSSYKEESIWRPHTVKW